MILWSAPYEKEYQLPEPCWKHCLSCSYFHSQSRLPGHVSYAYELNHTL
ncbi:MAG: hypothetical protein K0Q72_5091, partial [Armatimonadetes bacterium]|nr:hypothetical protein [Armatimonadota bacterium]